MKSLRTLFYQNVQQTCDADLNQEIERLKELLKEAEVLSYFDSKSIN